MNTYSELEKITEITPNIYLSGILPFENVDLIKKLGIKYILSCVDRKYIMDIHDKMMIHDPEITILYLPLFDDPKQNLWNLNQNDIKLVRYTDTTEAYDDVAQLLKLYQNKPMIEIGYHFMDQVISSGNKILVHCMAGSSRSVALIAYYFMKKYHLNYSEAINYIQSKRSIAHPNKSFEQQLRLYQIMRDQFNQNDAQTIVKKFQ